ncbi:hypothetical protein [Streptomyces scopuliridis]|uniref:hypothetical protein n=1 Tax=Streptomyces scopuliridis TaxID=452529 RepID=UPI0035DC39AF
MDSSPAPDHHPSRGPGPLRTLALFYRDGERPPGLVIPGHLDGSEDIDRLATADRVTVEPLT